MAKPILDDLIERYENNKDNINKKYQHFFREYIERIKIEKKKDQSKGDRYFVYRNFKPVLENFILKNGFEIYAEVNLYNPKSKIPFINNLIKDKFKDFKERKNIDFIAISKKNRFLFIEVKMAIGTNSMLSGLFELGLIDHNKLDRYDPYFILLSGYTNDPKKYQKRFEILKEIFIDKSIRKKCMFVLLDPAKCINEDKFYNEVLS